MILFLFVIVQLVVLNNAGVTMFFSGKRSSDTTVVNFSCKLSEAPVGDTIEFLVNDVTAFNIRYFGDHCYMTDSQIPCSDTKCHCSMNGKNYKWIYHHKVDEGFEAMCRAKTEDGCFIEVKLTLEGDSDEHSILTPSCSTKSSSAVILKGNGIVVSSLILFYCLRNRELRRNMLAFYCLVIFVVFCMTKASASKQNVTLTVDNKNDHMELVCKVKNLVNEVYFLDPKGRQRGYCTAPVPSIAAGVCDPHSTQNIDSNTTYFVTTANEEDKGMWMCLHGMNTHEKAYASANIEDSKKPSKEVDIPTSIGLVFAGVIVGFVIGILCYYLCQSYCPHIRLNNFLKSFYNNIRWCISCLFTCCRTTLSDTILSKSMDTPIEDDQPRQASNSSDNGRFDSCMQAKEEGVRESRDNGRCFSIAYAEEVFNSRNSRNSSNTFDRSAQWNYEIESDNGRTSTVLGEDSECYEN